MLNTSRVEANIPAADLKRARDFYEHKLGLIPVEQSNGVYLRYATAGGTTFNVYETEFAGQAGHTIAQWHVDDIEAEVQDLRSKGIEFAVYDLPGVEWKDGIATLPGMGRAAWFTDSEGNTMCLDEAEPA